MSLLRKVKNEIGKSASACVSVQYPHSVTRYCPGHVRVEGNDRADRLAGKENITSDLRLGRSEVLRSLKHGLRAQSQETHTINRLRRDMDTDTDDLFI